MLDSFKILQYYLIIGLAIVFVLMIITRKFKSWLHKRKSVNIFSSLHILTVTDEVQCKKACDLLKSHCQIFSALGFDCEWVFKNEVRRPVALLQLASAKGLCCLFRLNIMNEIPCELKSLLSDVNIIKLGISPNLDAKLLCRDYYVQVQGTLDLRHLFQANYSLASLVSAVLKINLDKSLGVKCSNWEALELTNAQKEYAAKDAFVAIQIFEKWLLKNECEIPSHKIKLENCQSAFTKLKSHISRHLDVPYSSKLCLKQNNVENKGMPYQEQNIEKLNAIFKPRTTKLYHNNFMYAPDGTLLCSCDKRKAQWYVDKGLAEILPGDPFSIKLLFEPNKKREKLKDDLFYQQLKQNKCVVCGSSESFLKHHIVPKEYRKYFPVVMKSHQSHDIVLLCVSCHNLATYHNQILRKELANLCNAPLSSFNEKKRDRLAQKITYYAKALLCSENKIPNKRKEEIELQIKNYFNVDHLTEDILQKGASLKTDENERNEELMHGYKVVNYFKNQEHGLIKLEKLWRIHFIEKLKPQNLPELWSVNHKHDWLKTKI